MIYKWPGQIQAEMDTTTFVSTNDMVPTVLDILGLEPELELPGINVLNRQARNEREAVYSEDYNHDIADVHNPTESLEHWVALRKPWKLILPNETDQEQIVQKSGNTQLIRTISIIEEPELYHIVNDPHERQNVASQNPEVVKELKQLIDNWWEPEF